LTSLVKQIDRQLGAAAGKAARPPGAYVIFTGKAGGLGQRLSGMAQREGLQHVSLCIGEPPEDYGVAGEADVTVVIYRVGRRRQEEVTANIALRKGELDAAKAEAVVKALSEALPR
jgi:hypothetical protein